MKKVNFYTIVLVSFVSVGCILGVSPASEILSEPGKAEIEKADTDTLLKWAVDPDRRRYRLESAQALGDRKVTKAIPTLRKMLSDKFGVVRLKAASALLGMGDESGRLVLREMLKDPIWNLSAAIALAKNGDDSGLEVARAKLNSPVVAFREEAIEAIGSSKNETVAFGAIQAGLKDSDLSVRMTAIRLLEQRATKGSFDFLKTLLFDPDKKTRSFALDAIASTCLSDALPILIDALSNPDGSIRAGAAAKLKWLTGRTGPDAAAFNQEKATQMSQEWKAWWEANKTRYPSGIKIVQPTPAVGACK